MSTAQVLWAKSDGTKKHKRSLMKDSNIPIERVCDTALAHLYMLHDRLGV